MSLKKKKLFHRAASALLAATMLVTGVFAGIPGGMPRVQAAAADTAYLEIGGSVDYAGYHTNRMYADDNLAYCVQPSKYTPDTGDYEKSYDIGKFVVNPDNEKYVRHVSFYCYGSPGFDKKYFPDKWYDGTAMTNDRYLALSHIILSDIIASDGAKAMFGCNEAFKKWCRREVIGYEGSTLVNEKAPRNALKYLPVPDAFQVYILDTGSRTQCILGFDYEENGKLTLKKVSANTDITKGNSCYSLEGAVYYVYSDKACTDKVGTLTTTKSGKSNSIELEAGDYWVKEHAAPEGYELDKEKYQVTVTPEKSTTLKVSDIPANDPLGITIEKTDSKTGSSVQGAASLEGAQFTVKYYDGQYKKSTLPSKATKTWVIETKAEKSNGKTVHWAELDNGHKVSGDSFYLNDADNAILPVGTITIEETKAPAGYTIEGNTFSANGVTVKDNLYLANIRQEKNGGSATLTVGNVFQNTEEVIRGGVKIRKYDEETKKAVPQGDAKLEGAEYTIVSANANAVVVNGKTYKNGQAVAKLTTDASGKAQTSSDLLPYGNYYVYETKAPVGYKLNGTKVNFSIKESGKLVDLTTGQLADPPVKQAFEIIKISSAGESGETAVVKGAELTVKLKSEVQKSGWDAAASYAVLVTDAKGYARSPELPYGTYTVRETKTPANLSTIPDFEVKVTEDSRTPQAWRVFNDVPMQAYVKIVKEDAVTGKTVCLSGASFKIRNTDTGEYVTQKVGNHKVDTFVTEEDGTVVTPKMLRAGNYEVIEVTAPDGYILNADPVAFSISESGAVQGDFDEDNELVITVKAVDGQVTGNVTIYKHGEILTGSSLSEEEDGTCHTEFTYEDAPLAGHTFQIVADEDIYTPDHQTDKDGNRLLAVYDGVELAKDAVVRVTSGQDGYAKAEGLPLGKYHVEEVQVTDGYCVNTQVDSFELAYEGQTVSVVSHASDYENQRVRAELDLVKSGAKTDEKIAGAVYGLYTAEDIYAASGDLLAEAGSLVEAGRTDEDGQIRFISDVPLGHYGIREISVPDGCILDTQTYEVDLTWQGQDIGTIQKELEVTDDEICVSVSKKDITTDGELPGAHLQILDAEGKVYEEWDSTEEAHVIYQIPAGTYTLHEDYTPIGYSTAKDVSFTVEETGEIQPVVMYDEWTKLSVSKRDITTDEELPGAHLQILDADGKVYEEWDSTDEAHMIYQIPAGKYTLHEDYAPLGYATAKDISFEVKDTGEVQTVVMYDEWTKLSVSKKDITTEKELPGAHLQILDADGKVYEEWDSTDEAHMIYQIPAGKYTLHEDYAPLGYATAKDISFEVKDTGEVQTVVMYDEPTQLSVSKKDITTEKELPGAHLQILDADGKVYEEWKSTDEAHIVSRIPAGTYTLHEVSAPKGYQIAKDVKFKVKDTGVLQTVTMYDKPVPEKKIIDRDIPKTGDTDINFYFLAAVMGAALALAGGLARKKFKSKKNK